MPRIPTFKSEKLPPGTSGLVPINPDMAGATGRAMAGLGREVSGLGKTYDKIYEQERKAHDAIEAAKIETALRNKEREISDKLHTETDYTKYDEIVNNGAKEIQALLPKNASRDLSAAFLRSAGQSEATLKDVAQKKRWQEMDTQGKMAFLDLKTAAKENWIKAETDEERDSIEANLYLQGDALVKSLATDRLWMKGQIETFRTETKAEGQVKGATILYEMSKTDPIGTAKRLREDKQFMSYLEPDTRLKLQKQLDVEAKTHNEDQISSAEIVKLKREVEGKYPGEPDKALAEALRIAESPDFQERINDYSIHQKIITSLSTAYMQNEKMYKSQADDIKGELIVQVLEDKVTKDGLSKNEQWKSLRATDRAYISNFADSKKRADLQEIRQARSLNIAERQAKQQQMQIDATVFFGQTMTKIATGAYTDANQIIKDFSVENPIIQSKVNAYVSLFKTIESAPDLKYGISTIKQAAKTGLLDPSDPKNNLFKQGSLMTELRTKYMEEEDFRGEKINVWLNNKLNPEVKNGVAEWLRKIWDSRGSENPQNSPLPNAPTMLIKPAPTQADLEFTAKKHGITVEKVKERLGIIDAT